MLLRQRLYDLMKTAVTAVVGQEVPVVIEQARQAAHGDFSCGVAMTLAKQLKKAPLAIAQAICAQLSEQDWIAKIEVLPPGFINVFIADSAWQQGVQRILEQPDFGRGYLDSPQKVYLEFVSANPTGPLHVGHGRSAAFGASLAGVMDFAGYEVHREYYLNDAGRQMDLLAVSVWLRYLQAQGKALSFPLKLYQGEYVREVAAGLTLAQAQLVPADTQPLIALCAELQDKDREDMEAKLDELVTWAREQLGNDTYLAMHQQACDAIVADIRQDLDEFGVQYEHWFSERGLLEQGVVSQMLEQLKERELLYEKEGALWFKSEQFGDDKDRVVVRANGQYTYFATDIAYHWYKFQQGHNQIIDIFGADHHGYMARLRGSLQALGCDIDAFHILLVQFAVLYRGDEKIPMSTRSGEFVTLRELREEVGNDAARFFYLLRKPEQHLDFDLELAKSKSNENPVYYVQYAHARVCSVLKQLTEKGWSWVKADGCAALQQLTSPQERELMVLLAQFPQQISDAAAHREPHRIGYYVRELATLFHAYYNASQFLVDDKPVRDARLALIVAVRQVLATGLGILGVSAPQSM